MSAVAALDRQAAIAARRSRRVATVLCGLAVAWAAAAAVGLAVLPTGESATVTSDADGRIVTVVERTTLLENEGTGVLVLLAAPAVVAALALAAGLLRRARPVRLVLGGLLWLFSLAGMMTIGLFLMPVAVGVLVAGALSVPRPSAP